MSRPAQADPADAGVGCGRANNLLRHLFGMPLIRDALGRTVEPALPGHIGRAFLSARCDPANTVLLTCGNPASIADIRLVAAAQRIRVETEDW